VDIRDARPEIGATDPALCFVGKMEF
jgi:hypothetical protein